MSNTKHPQYLFFFLLNSFVLICQQLFFNSAGVKSLGMEFPYIHFKNLHSYDRQLYTAL